MVSKPPSLPYSADLADLSPSPNGSRLHIAGLPDLAGLLDRANQLWHKSEFIPNSSTGSLIVAALLLILIRSPPPAMLPPPCNLDGWLFRLLPAPRQFCSSLS